MKVLMSSLALAIILTGTANAAPNNKPPSRASAGVLKQALRALVTPLAGPTVQVVPGVDRDQGDEHASPRAILVVCSKSTPAAQRSAICPTEPITPD